MDKLMRIIACSVMLATGCGAQAEAVIYDCRADSDLNPKWSRI